MTRSIRFGALAATATAALIIGACSSEPTGPGTQQIDVNTVLADLSTNSNVTTGAFAAGAVPTAAAAPGSPGPKDGGCPYVPAAGNFQCPPMVMNGITNTRTYWIVDVDGKPQSKPDPKTTFSIRTVTTAKGTMSMPTVVGVAGAPGTKDTPGTMAPPVQAGTNTIDRTEDMTLSGLNTNKRLMNGTVSMKSDMTIGTGANAQHTLVNRSVVTSNVQLPAPSPTPRGPMGGTITTDETITPGNNPPFTMHSVLTFNADGSFTMVVTYNGVTKTCTAPPPTVPPVTASGGKVSSQPAPAPGAPVCKSRAALRQREA